MTNKHARPFVLCCGLVLGTLSLVSVARAQGEIDLTGPPRTYVDPPAKPAPDCRDLLPEPWPLATSVPPITRQQLETFAAMVDEPCKVVWQRLISDPRMFSLAIEAVDESVRRQYRGKIMEVLGFTQFGVGVVALVASLIWTESFDCAGDDSLACENKGWAALAALESGALAVGGLGVGIAGVIVSNRQNSTETEAIDRYRFHDPSRPPPISPSCPPSRPMGSPGKAFSLPLLSFTF